MENCLKLVRTLLYPFLILSLCLYLSLYFLSPLKVAYQIGMLSGAFLSVLFVWREMPKNKKELLLLVNWKTLSLLVIGLFITMVFGFVLSPMIKHVIVDGHVLLGLTSLGDYYKHLYILTSIKTGGLPAQHPFYASASLSYYYGYYLIPSAISNIFSFDLIRVFFFYILLTNFLIFYVVIVLAMSFFRLWYQRLLAVALFVFGTGLDIIPTLMQARSGVLTANHIEFWSQTLNLSNYLVNNIYTALLWVPQHSLASLIVLVTGIFLLKDKKLSVFWLTLSIWFCVISSTFVAVTFAIWLGLAFFTIKNIKQKLILSGLLSLGLLFPYLVGLVGRSSIFSFGFYMTPVHYLNFLSPGSNYVLTFFTDYGLIFMSIPLYFVLNSKKNLKETSLICLAIILPPLIGLFVKSAGFNDFTMRSIMPSQMAMPFLMAFSLDSIEKYLWKKILFLLLLLNLILSTTGLFYEIHFRLIDRGVIDWKTSELLEKLRGLDVSNLAVIDNEDWVFLIPSYGYQRLYSPRIFDSAGYISSQGLKKQEAYGKEVSEIFINENTGINYQEVLVGRQRQLDQVSHYFRAHKDFNFIIPRNHGSQKGLNPWLNIFETLQINNSQLTPYFSLLKGGDLAKVLSASKITVEVKAAKKITLKDNSFSLGKGLWAITVCKQNPMSRLRLEFEKIYLFFDHQPSENRQLCAGNLYYQDVEGHIEVSKSSQFDSLYLAPIKLSPR